MKKFYVYAGYYELYISSEEMPAPYMYQAEFDDIEKAIEYAEEWEDTIIFCENVKDDLPEYIQIANQETDYEYFKW